MSKYKNVAARTDDDIGDEEAGRMRKTLADQSQRRRKAEKERIAKANAENEKRLAAITAKTDDGDGLIGGGSPQGFRMSTTSQAGRDELGEVRDFIASQRQAYIKKDNHTHRTRLANMKATIDDDTEDDETGEARARMRVESAARRRADVEKLREANRAFFQRIKGAQPVTDTKIWDDGAGSAGEARAIVAAQAKARRIAEAKKLATENKAYQRRMSNVRAVTDDGDGNSTSLF